MALPISLISSHGVISNSEYLEILREKYDFQPTERVFVHMDIATFLEPPLRNVGVYIGTFNAGYRLPTSIFLDEVLHKNGFNVYDVTHNVLSSGGPYIRTEATSDSAPKLLSQDQEIFHLLESFIVVPKEFPKCILVGPEICTEWRRRQEMPGFFSSMVFRPIALRESLPPPCQTFAKGFTTPVVLVPSQSAPVGKTPGNPSVVLLVMLPPPIPSEVLERL
ncbi:unnamed protein product [Lactuca saligna]|uniref:Uncharacterized protein n=1 Tax=Lactuca saligna TaxID=75948 RepID=A0AA35VAV1_LACSI|nr:unnamed protein product [Lactuca saligna]